jgi:two-component system, chemotaxis family, chemotaxis protein CheY
MTKKAVLIVEDSTPFRTLMGSLLSRDYNVVSARNGLEAMMCLRNGLMPDIIVTDVQMPELDGAELISNLRCSGMLQNIPVVVVSGSCEEVELVEIRKMGAQEILVKPFKPFQLQNTINRLTRPACLPVA